MPNHMRYKSGTPITSRITQGTITQDDVGKIIAYIYGRGYLCHFPNGSAILSSKDFKTLHKDIKRQVNNV